MSEPVKTRSAERILRTAKIKAVESHTLILETSDTGEDIRWPLSTLSGALPVNGEISLELLSSAQSLSASDLPASSRPNSPSSSEAETQDSRRRKLLEQMIN